jgi:hypothetical protein
VKTNVRAFLAPMAFCAAALIVYAGAFHGNFHYDDSLTILENPHLSDWHTFVGHLGHMVRPVLYSTFLFDRSLYGTNPAGYHLLNLLLHFGSGLLIYRILSRAVTEETRLVPFLTALLFLIHPMATETVAYISGRASGLMAFLYLFAFFLYIKASEHQQTLSIRRLHLSGAVLFFLLAICSKETAVTLPIILLLWDVFIGRLRGSRLSTAVVSRHSPFWVILLLAVVWVWNHPRYTALAEFSLNIRPLWDNLLSELHAWAYALALIFTPWNQNFDHDLPEFHSLFQWPLPLDLLLLSGTVATGLFSWRRYPLVAFGLGWFFIQLLPISLIPRNDLLSERNLYLPSIGLFLAIAALGSYFTQWVTTLLARPGFVRYTFTGIAALLVIVLGTFTYQRNLLYQDRLLLWSDAVRKSPAKARPHNNLGYAYALHDDWDRAIGEFRTAARLDPDFILAQQNLRDAYLHRVGRQ